MAVVEKPPEHEAHEPPLLQAALRARAADASPVRVSDVAHVLAEATELHLANHLATVGRLTAGMAHEFGTPLGVVLARAQMIREDCGTVEDMRADADAIIHEVKRMTQMCREVLDYARPRAALRVRMDLVPVVRHALGLLLPDARTRSVRLVLGEHTKAIVLGDASKLTQVLTNLILNGLQATPAGGSVVLGVSQVSARHPRGTNQPALHACITVKDAGLGILETDLPRIFEAFFTTKKQGEGTGLGLAVSSALVREHGGFIDVDTAPGKGSCFSVYLPLAASA